MQTDRYTRTHAHTSFCAKAHGAHVSHACSPASPQRELVATCFFEMSCQSHLELIISSFLDVLGHVGSTRLRGRGCTPTHGQGNCCCLLLEVAGRAGHEHSLELPGLVQPWFCAVHQSDSQQQCYALSQPFQHSSLLLSPPLLPPWLPLYLTLQMLLLVVMVPAAAPAWPGRRWGQWALRGSGPGTHSARLLSVCSVVVSAGSHAKECRRSGSGWGWAEASSLSFLECQVELYHIC